MQQKTSLVQIRVELVSGEIVFFSLCSILNQFFGGMYMNVKLKRPWIHYFSVSIGTQLSVWKTNSLFLVALMMEHTLWDLYSVLKTTGGPNLGH